MLTYSLISVQFELYNVYTYVYQPLWFSVPYTDVLKSCFELEPLRAVVVRDPVSDTTCPYQDKKRQRVTILSNEYTFQSTIVKLVQLEKLKVMTVHVLHIWTHAS